MVDLGIPIHRKYNYYPLRRIDSAQGRTYETATKDRLPSVTSILSATKDDAKLVEWVQRVGEAEAERIKTDAANVGTYMHNVIERLIAFRDLPRPTNWWMIKGYEMGYRLVNTYFSNLDEVWGSEVGLHYPGKYAGTADLLGVYRGNESIIDFKQSLKPKRHEWITDYFHQLAAYALAHDVVHGSRITHGYVLVALREGGTQEFSTTGDEFQAYKDAWMARVARFIERAAEQASPEAAPQPSQQ